MSRVIVINRGLEERRSRSGRAKRTIRIDAEPIAIHTDPKALGQPVADALAHHFRERVRNISAAAAPATIKYRERAAKAFAEGKPWAMKRYAGGRTGATQPNQSDRMFNDSGRFANTIVANASKDNAWRINVAANRLDERTAGASGVLRIWNRLIELVPEFGDLQLLLEGNAILRRTIQEVARSRIKVGKMSSKELTPFQAFSALFLRPAA